jgi:hypothetical protein
MLGKQRNLSLSFLPKAARSAAERAKKKTSAAERNAGTAPPHNDVEQAFITLLEKHVQNTIRVFG